MSEDEIIELFPPGEYLRDELQARGWSQTDFAAILDRDISLVNDIVLGKRKITPRTATDLSKALGTSAEVWLRLDADYQLAKRKQPPPPQEQPRDNHVERRAQLYSKAPIKDMFRRGWISETKDIDELEHQVLKFFGKQSLDEDFSLAHAAKKSASYETVSPSQSAWMARARHLARGITATAFKPKAVATVISRLQQLTHAPEEARLVPRTLAESGIRFLVVEDLPGTLIDGVTFWLDAESPVIAMSLRYDRIDNFWFVLFHELGHVDRKDGLTTTPLLDIDIDAPGDQPEAERAVSDFAGRHLLPEDEVNDFIVRTQPLFSTYKIQGFAERIHVHPGLVVGRLQHLKKIDFSHHRRLLTPVRHEVTQVALTDGYGYTAPV